jgi:predicted acylesterase/phospholipase RssA
MLSRSWLFVRGFPKLFTFFFAILIVAELREYTVVTGEPWKDMLSKALVFLIRFGVVFAGVLVAYNLSALLYAITRRLWHYSGLPRVTLILRRRWQKRSADPAPKSSTHRANQKQIPIGLDDGEKPIERIGIILSGGGAKGAYQAGALSAIHEYLEERGALEKVKMIAGTSIGSWNAMFWLANLIHPQNRDEIGIEEWWSNVSLSKTVDFGWYFPFFKNSFFRTMPWRQEFQEIFLTPPRVSGRLASLLTADPLLRFYFTRANVGSGQLEYATNWADIEREMRANPWNEEEVLPIARPGEFEIVTEIKHLENAVFASMDLPPLFPYVRGGQKQTLWYEDGGVLDNLPVRFGTHVEECDLLFVLPLNASFASSVNRRSVLKRLTRVMNVRQGALERNALKLTTAINRLGADPSNKFRRVHVFTICPSGDLAINTAEFWKTKAAGEAFWKMHDATRNELANDQNFKEDTNPARLQIALVDEHGQTARRPIDDM